VDVAKEIIKLKEEKVDGIVMDLRNNGGGYLNEVVQMAGLFINDGPYCTGKRQGQ
jgi:carboxyl-terminal processing protease